MIFDIVENLPIYFKENKYIIQAYDYLNNIDKYLGSEYIELVGKKMFARIMTYSLKDRDVCRFESHNEYIDIQSVIKGSEGFEWAYNNSLTVVEEYNIENDVIWYNKNKIMTNKIDIKKGEFVLFSPHDAHMPQQKTVYMDVEVTKVVVKVHRELIFES